MEDLPANQTAAKGVVAIICRSYRPKNGEMLIIQPSNQSQRTLYVTPAE